MDIKKIFDEETYYFLNTEKLEWRPRISKSMMVDPKHLAFVLSRYKFVAKMLEGRSSVLEVGGDAFGASIVAQSVGKLSVVDWEERFIEDDRKRLSFADNIDFIQHDIN